MKIIATFIVLVLFCGAAFARVASGTLHYSDANLVNSLIVNAGFSATVKIAVSPTYDTNYYIAFYNDWYSFEGGDFEKVVAGFAAAAVVSRETDWTSSYVIVSFQDKTFMMTTYAARTLNTYISRLGYCDDEAMAYFLENVDIMDSGLNTLTIP